MSRTCYVIEKCNGQWVVSAYGLRVLICERKKTASMITRWAAESLRFDHACASWVEDHTMPTDTDESKSQPT
jgi:hypothetical protein